MGRYYDVTMKLKNSMAIFEGDPEFKMENLYNIKEHGYNVSSLNLGTHTGTHIDAPRHFFEDGTAVDSIPVEKLVGKAKVFFIDKDSIDYEDIKDLNIEKHDKIIFKTPNSRFIDHCEFHKDFTALTKEAAEFLVKQEIHMVGIDYMSIESFYSEDEKVHEILLSNEVVILEYLDLREIEEGQYEITALPLRIKDGDGSPARVILREVNR